LQHSETVLLRLLALLVVALAAPGCAALALPPLAAVLSGGAGEAVKVGVDTTVGGTSYRTFSAPLADVRDAVRQAFRALEIVITEDGTAKDGTALLTGEAYRRKIDVKLEPVTPMLTRLRMVVRQGLLGRDRATAAELIEQTARALETLSPPGASALPRAR
jgi:hypothetical protein